MLLYLIFAIHEKYRIPAAAAFAKFDACGDLHPIIYLEVGDGFSGKNGHVELDGREIVEPYAVHRHPEISSDELNNFGPTKVPAGELFVMGDDRDESLDSRVRSGPSDYGPVFVTDVVGKVIYRFSSKLGQSEYDGQKIK